jgi:hypothetical protein
MERYESGDNIPIQASIGIHFPDTFQKHLGRIGFQAAVFFDLHDLVKLRLRQVFKCQFFDLHRFLHKNRRRQQPAPQIVYADCVYLLYSNNFILVNAP